MTQLVNYQSSIGTDNSDSGKAGVNFKEFEKENLSSISLFILVQKGTSLEKFRKDIAENKEIQNAFIIDGNNKLKGWITDTLLLRYLNQNHL